MAINYCFIQGMESAAIRPRNHWFRFAAVWQPFVNLGFEELQPVYADAIAGRRPFDFAIDQTCFAQNLEMLARHSPLRL